MRGPGIPAHGNSLPVFETDPDIYRESVMVNVVGTFNMTRAALPHMMAAGAGKIINLTTSLRNFYQTRNSPYGVTKAAEESETAIWAADLAESGVTVNSLLPGGASALKLRLRMGGDAWGPPIAEYARGASGEGWRGSVG